MKIQDQMTWTDLPEALRSSIEFDAATEILWNLTTLDAIDGDLEDVLLEDFEERAGAAPRAHDLLYGETAMWF